MTIDNIRLAVIPAPEAGDDGKIAVATLSEVAFQTLNESIYNPSNRPRLAQRLAQFVESDHTADNTTFFYGSTVEARLTSLTSQVFTAISFAVGSTPNANYRLRVFASTPSWTRGALLRDQVVTALGPNSHYAAGWIEFPIPAVAVGVGDHIVALLSLPNGVQENLAFRRGYNDGATYPLGSEWTTSGVNNLDVSNNGQPSYTAPAAVGIRIGVASAPKTVTGPLDPGDLPHGITSARPALTASQRGFFFDDTLGKLIVWTGAAWRDAVGAVV